MLKLLTVILIGIPSVLCICEPSCRGKLPGEKTEDPKDCRRYYICMPGEIPTNSPLECGSNNIFDPIIGECVSGSQCQPSCVLPSCHMTCTDNIDLISDPFNCSVYRMCLAGDVGATYVCPPDKPYFDGVYCGSDETKCCSELCTPYCYPGVIQAPDPEDCKCYYICEGVGKPELDHHFCCPDGMVFDISHGRCMSNVQCRPLCDATVFRQPNGRPYILKRI